MGLKFRKRLGGKHLKLNVGKKGISSTSFKIANGVTINSKKGLTLGVPGTGLSYNFGKKNKKSTPVNENADYSNQFNNNFKAVTGGYNKKSLWLIGICIIMLFTPLNPLGLILLIPALLWFIIDTIIKIIKTNKIAREDD